MSPPKTLIQKETKFVIHFPSIWFWVATASKTVNQKELIKTNPRVRTPSHPSAPKIKSITQCLLLDSNKYWDQKITNTILSCSPIIGDNEWTWNLTKWHQHRHYETLWDQWASHDDLWHNWEWDWRWQREWQRRR